MNTKWDEKQMDFAKNLQMFRKQANLSQEDLADKLLISRQAVSKWEIGQSTPDLDTCMKLCEILKVTPDQMFLGNETSKELGVPEKRDTWLPIALLCVFLMVSCICGTILLIFNLYIGNFIVPFIYYLSLVMIIGSLLFFILAIAIYLMHYLKEKRDQKA